jgi:hypothetical protein
MEITNRDKAVLIGLYLSKFDLEGLENLGFSSFTEAFNTLGYAIGVKPASLKNYRDEFDPLFPNSRKGWHKREIRDYCKNYYHKYKDWQLNPFSEFIRCIVYPHYETQIFSERIFDDCKRIEQTTFAKRLATGQAAEQYFRDVYNKISIFENFILEDTTKLGCGFDFKLHSNVSDKFLAIEVKGINGSSGNIMLTEKEFKIANYLKNNYYVFVVKNFVDKPEHIYFQDPLNCTLKFEKTESKIIQINYSAKI